MPLGFAPAFTCGHHGSGHSAERSRHPLFFASHSYTYAPSASFVPLFVADSHLSSVANNSCTLDSERAARQRKASCFSNEGQPSVW
jgi:hypothetical protein